MVILAHASDSCLVRQDRENIARLFGDALRAARNDAGLSQEELAFRAGVDRTFVSRAERGVRQPALATVFQLAQGLGIRASELVEMMGDPELSDD